MTDEATNPRTAIVAPLSARGGLESIEANVAFGLAAADLVRACGEVPMAFAWESTDAGWLDDDDPSERSLGIMLGHELMLQCGRARVFLPPGCDLSDGMREDLEVLMGAGLPIHVGLKGSPESDAGLKRLLGVPPGQVDRRIRGAIAAPLEDVLGPVATGMGEPCDACDGYGTANGRPYQQTGDLAADLAAADLCPVCDGHGTLAAAVEILARSLFDAEEDPLDALDRAGANLPSRVEALLRACRKVVGRVAGGSRSDDPDIRRKVATMRRHLDAGDYRIHHREWLEQHLRPGSTPEIADPFELIEAGS